MSASGAGSDRVRRLFERASAADSLAGIIVQGIGAIFLAIGTAISSGVLTVADIFIVPITAFTTVVGELINAVFGGAAQIINFGAIATALSIGPGGQFNVGPFTFALGIGAVLLGFYVVLAYVSEEDTTNFFPLIGTGFDLPTPGIIDAEEEEEG